MLKIKDNVDLKELEKYDLKPIYGVNELTGKTFIKFYTSSRYTGRYGYLRLIPMKKIFWNIGKFFDKHLKWHSCTKSEFDGASWHGICKYCDAKCLQDSQGNWFEK